MLSSSMCYPFGCLVMRRNRIACPGYYNAKRHNPSFRSRIAIEFESTTAKIAWTVDNIFFLSFCPFCPSIPSHIYCIYEANAVRVNVFNVRATSQSVWNIISFNVCRRRVTLSCALLAPPNSHTMPNTNKTTHSHHHMTLLPFGRSLPLRLIPRIQSAPRRIAPIVHRDSGI